MTTFLCIFLAALNTAIGDPSVGNELKVKADHLREEGDTLKALDSYNHAIVAYQKEHNYDGIFEALKGRMLAWKHLYYQDEDPIYVLFLQREAETIAQYVKLMHLEGHDHLVQYLIASAAYHSGDYAKAEKEYREAIHLYPNEDPEKGDWVVHLGETMIRNGKKEEGKRVVLEGVKYIESKADEVDSFLRKVWVSGAMLRMAKALQKDDPKESALYFNQAKAIIDGDSRLVVRKRQMEKFDAKERVE